MSTTPRSAIMIAEAMGTSAFESMNADVDDALIGEAQDHMVWAINLILQAHGVTDEESEE